MHYSILIQWILAFVSIASLFIISNKINKQPSRWKFLITLYALSGVVISVFPVAFQGKSFVAPNCGVLLLYNDQPTIPNYKPVSRWCPNNGSDTGALMWDFLPTPLIQSKAFISGEMPLWNRNNWCGVPLVGQGLSMLFEPLNLLTMIAGGNSVAWDMKFILAKIIYTISIGYIIYILTSNVFAASLISFLVSFIGFYTYRINHPSVFAWNYAPLILIGWIILKDIDRSKTWWPCILIFISDWCMFFSGTVKEGYLTLLLANLIGFAWLIYELRLNSDLIYKSTIGIVTSILFLGASIPYWYTFLHTLSNSYNAYNDAVVWQIPLTLLIGIFDEIYFRPFIEDGGVIFSSLNLSIGSLFIYGVVDYIKTKNKEYSFWLLSWFVYATFIFAIFPPFILKQVPFIKNIYHFSNAISFPFYIITIIVAGIAIKNLTSKLSETVKNNTRIASLILIVLYLLAISLTYCSMQTAAFSKYIYKPGIIFSAHAIFSVLTVFGAIIFIQSFNISFRKKNCFAVIAAFSCLLTLVRFFDYGDINTSYVFNVLGDRGDFNAKSEAVEFIKRRTAESPARVIGVKNTLFAGWNSYYGLEGVGGATALVPRELKLLLDFSGIPTKMGWMKSIDGIDIPKYLKLLDFLNVKYYLIPHNEAAYATNTLDVVNQKDLDVGVSKSAWPRAFFSNHWDFCSSPQALLNIIYNNNSGKPFVTLSNDSELNTSELNSDVSAGEIYRNAKFVHLGCNETTVEIETPTAGIIVLCESFYKDDMMTYVNGVLKPTLCVNKVYRGVKVEGPGKYHIVFKYKPKHWDLLIIVSAISFMLFLSLLTYFKLYKK